MLNSIAPSHPGLFINEFFVQPLDLSFSELAEKLNTSESSVSRLLNAKSCLSYEMAIKLGKLFDHSPEYFMGLQVKYGLYKASKEVDTSNIITL